MLLNGQHELPPVRQASSTQNCEPSQLPLRRSLYDELRMRVGRFLPIINPWGFAKMCGGIQASRASARISSGTRSHVDGLEGGGSHAALQQMLSHPCIVTTQRRARINDDIVRREVERLEMGS